ncbi:MAG: cell division protein FtsA [Kiritimatiellae bacterium]|nr:cell division protein FtsA [Kiritimatiellia bacterium]
MPASPVIVALELGTAKVIALVGEMREDGHIMITGMGEQPSRGISKGLVVDIEAAADATKAALAAAEESGEVTIRQVVLAVSGGHVRSDVHRGVVPVRDRSEITRHDMQSVMNIAKAVNMPTDREVLHTICQHYCIDGQQRVVTPEGMEGARLELDMLVVHGLRSPMRNAIKAVEDLMIDVKDVIYAGLASGLSVLSVEQKKGGVLVIDMGAGTTEYVAYAGNVIAATGALGVGGDHVTNDIALAFGIPERQAERCKIEHGGAVIPADVEGKVAVAPGVGFGGRTISRQSLLTVINARVDETLRMVQHRLEEDKVPPHLAAGVVLVGGCAHMPGVTDLAAEIFKMPCTVGRPREVSGLATATEGPEYATCTGLIQYACRKWQSRRRAPALTGLIKNILKR